MKSITSYKRVSESRQFSLEVSIGPRQETWEDVLRLSSTLQEVVLKSIVYPGPEKVSQQGMTREAIKGYCCAQHANTGVHSLWKHRLLSPYLRDKQILIDTMEYDRQIVLPIQYDSAGSHPADVYQPVDRNRDAAYSQHSHSA